MSRDLKIVKIFLGVGLLWPGVAEAKCHHFTRWFYPRPQVCALAKFTASVPPQPVHAVQPTMRFLTPDLVERLRERLERRGSLDENELLLSRAGMLKL